MFTRLMNENYNSSFTHDKYMIPCQQTAKTTNFLRIKLFEICGPPVCFNCFLALKQVIQMNGSLSGSRTIYLNYLDGAILAQSRVIRIMTHLCVKGQSEG